MIKATKFCAYSNDGKAYTLTPAVIVTPLYSVAEGYRMLPCDEFASDPAEVKKLYPVGGVRIAFKLLTYHLGIEINWHRHLGTKGSDCS